MKNKPVWILAFAIAVVMTAAGANAADDLFDTKTAAKQLEQGLAQLRAKHYDAAIAALEESVATAPEAEAYYYLGYAYYLKGRGGDSASRELSRENFEKAYELDPNFTPTRFNPSDHMPAPEQPKN